MDSTIVIVIMIGAGLLMGVLPFAIFMGLGTLTGISSPDARLLVTFFLAAGILSFLVNLGAGMAVQKTNCGSVKNMNQIMNNSGLAFTIQITVLLLAYFLPWLRGIVSNLLPPDTESVVLESVGYSYYSLWAALFGTAISSTLSGLCG
jgi:hypothetical protein